MGEVLRTARLLVQHALLYLLTGGVLVAWLWRDGDWVERIIVAAGLGVAVQALLVYGTLTGLRLGTVPTAIVLLCCAAGLVAYGAVDRAWIDSLSLIWRRMRDERSGTWRQWVRENVSSDSLAVVTLGVVFALLLGVRLYVVRTQAVAMWGDGYQHTMIAQLLADNNGLFDSWAPYAPLTTFTYHFGFHANVAMFHWLSGDPVLHATVWAGQVLNALAALCLYPLAVKVSGGRRWAGVGAVLVAGLLLPMPMHYTNWGRYTQLTGQVILAVAVYLTWAYLDAAKGSWRVVPVWIAVVALAVTHYRVLVFYAVFCLAYLVVTWGRDVWRRNLGRMAWVGGGALLLYLPWLIRVLPGQIVGIFVHQLTTAASEVSALDVQYNAIGDIKLYMAPWVWMLLLVSLGVGLWRRQRGVLIVAGWWFVLFVIANPRWLWLPGTGAINNFTLFLGVYIPAALLIGNVLGWLGGLFQGRVGWTVAAASCVVGLAFVGVPQRIKDLDVFEHSLVTQKDLEAMAWIRENTPADAKFLVNSFPAYGGTLVAGSDAGWWIPLLTGRASSLPPLNYGVEQALLPDYVEYVNALTRQLEESDLDALETVHMLCERGLTHVYIGQREGRVNYGGPHVLSWEEMARSPSYNLIYQQDRVSILSIECVEGS
jgi:hypothetical protein